MKNLIKILIMRLVWLALIIKKILFITRKPKEKFSNVLVVDLMGLGDIVCLTPFLEKLKESDKFGKITGCFTESARELSESFVEVDDYIIHRSYRQTLTEIIKRKFDLIIIPGWGVRHSLMTILNSSSVIGFLNDLTFTNKYINSFKLETIGLRKSKLNTDWADMSQLHLSQRSNLILEYFGISSVGKKIDFPINIENLNSRTFATFHCSATFEGRKWPLSRYKELAEKLIENNIVKEVFLIGGKSDYPEYNTICSSTIINYAGKGNLLATKELIEKAKLFVGNDSGPLHIATFCKIPVYSIMGPNLPIISGTISSLGHNFFNKMECCPCNQRDCSFNYKCIMSIDVSSVFERIVEDINKNYE